MLTPTRIIIHHSLTPDGSALSWPAIYDYHTQTHGWADIGYHAGIEEVNDRLVCMYGRPSTLCGAHTLGQNYDSLGFCFVGNFDRVRPGEQRLREAARRVLAPWCLRFGIRPTAIVGHRQFAHKSCPGLLFDVEELQIIVAEEMYGLRSYNAE